MVAEASPEKVDLTKDDNEIEMRSSIHSELLTQVCTICLKRFLFSKTFF